MSFNVASRVCDTTTTTGTGSITVTGTPIAGYRSLSAGGVGGGSTFYYLLEEVDGSGVATGNWEEGLGTVTATGPITFSRTVINSSNSGALVSFAAGTKRVHLTAPAVQIGLLGGVYKLTSSLTAQNFTTATPIGWTTNQFDLAPITPFHNNVTNNSRITIPAEYGDCYVRLSGQVSLNNILANETVDLWVRANGSGDMGHTTNHTPSTAPFYQVTTPPILTSSTDYYELMLQTSSDTSIDILTAGSRFAIEVLQ